MNMPLHRTTWSKKTLKYLLKQFPVPFPKMVGKHWWLSHPLQVTWNTEFHILAWVEKALHAGNTFIDVGAHAGWVALASSRIVGPTGHVVAIEPSPALASLIRYHSRLNRVPSIAVEEFAVTDSSGIADFFIHNRGISSINSLFESAVAREAPPESRIDRICVRTRSLDDYCESRTLIPNLIKIDVEGAELSVLRGASTILSKHKPALIVAVHPPLLPSGGENELFHLLQDYQYVLRQSHSIPLGDDLWGDYLFT